MEPLSKQRIIELARKQLIARNEVRTIKDIRVEPVRKLMTNSERGWKVFCIFDSEDTIPFRCLNIFHQVLILHQALSVIAQSDSFVL